jgi:hypothetical protein
LSLQTYYAKHLTNEKRRKYKKQMPEENQKIYINENNILGHPKNGQILVEEVQKYKDLNLTIYFRLVKAYLQKKFNFRKRNSKLDV